MSDERTQQAIDNLRALREMEREFLSVECSTGAGMEDVWTLLDYLAALEAVRDAAVEMRGYVDHRAMMIDMGDATLAEETLTRWDTALRRRGKGITTKVPLSTLIAGSGVTGGDGAPGKVSK